MCTILLPLDRRIVQRNIRRRNSAIMGFVAELLAIEHVISASDVRRRFQIAYRTQVPTGAVRRAMAKAKAIRVQRDLYRAPGPADPLAILRWRDPLAVSIYAELKRAGGALVRPAVIAGRLGVPVARTYRPLRVLEAYGLAAAAWVRRRKVWKPR